MRRFVALVLFSAITLALPSAAQAATITLAGFSVTANTADPGLVVSTSNLVAPGYSFNLPSVGSVHNVNLFSIGTSEGSIEADDLVDKPISVAYNFSAPAGTVGGPTNGFSDGFIQFNPFASNFLNCNVFIGGCGRVLWTAPSIFNFGTTGQFRVDLANVEFKTPGNASVGATFTLLSEDVAPVPEPASMILLGTGLLYGAQRKWRRKV